MKLKLRELIDAREALVELNAIKLPIKTAYSVSKIIRKANQELEFLTKIRQEVINKHLQEGIEMTPEINQLISDELNETLDTEIEWNLNKVDLSSISLPISMTAKDVYLLEPFMIFESDELS
jgi:hypothetical protein